MKPLFFEPYQNEPKRKLTALQEEILRLKKMRNATILAHNYVDGDIQQIADFCGDSLALSFAARDTNADVIVFCGVGFMAETAKILNPQKTVLIPDATAGCSLEESCQASSLKQFKELHKGAFVVSYINCSGAVKALSDVICTSGNATKIVEHFPKDAKIIFAPDKHLGSWVEEQTGRKLILWDGCCKAHASYNPAAIKSLKETLNAPVVCHPECPKEVRDICDFVCSTEKMIAWAHEQKSQTIIVATVFQMIHRLRREVPEKAFVAALPNESEAFLRCPQMDKNSLEKIRDCLRDMSPCVSVDAALIEKAKKPIEKMLEWSKS